MSARALSVAPLLLLLVAGQAGAAGKLVLLVSPAPLKGASPAAARVSVDSLLLALSTRLSPYDVETRRQSWRSGPAGPARVRLARQIGDAASAEFVVFYRLAAVTGGTVARQRVEVVIVDLRADATWSRRIALGEPTLGIERAMATAVVTLLRSRPRVRLGGPPPLPQPATRPASATRPNLRPAPRARRLAATVTATATVSVGYRLAFLVGPGATRQGPELTLGWRLGRLPLALLARAGYRLRSEGARAETRWSRWSLELGAGLRWTGALARRWFVEVSARVAAGRVAAEASSRDARQSDTLWELQLGGALDAVWQLHRHLGVVVGAAASWLPVGHSIAIDGSEVARSGGTELSLCVGLRTGF